jgi:hypothetical protein
MRCCETCSNVLCKILDRVPCSNQSERDKMANDVQNKINILKENGFHGATIGCLEEWVEELRQQAGEP